MVTAPKTVARVRPRLLFLCQTLPYPPHGGVEARTFNVLRLLAREFDVVALCFFRKGGAVQGKIRESVDALSEYARLQAFPIPQEWSRSRLIWDHLRSLMTHRVYTVTAYESAEYRQQLERLLATEVFDLVHMDSMDLSGYLPLLGGLPVVCVHHNAESQLLARRATVTTPAPLALYLKHQARLMSIEERRTLDRVALNVTVSQADAQTLRQAAPGARFHVVPNGVDVSLFSPSERVNSNEIVFLGGTAWFPNLDGMEWFCDAILPHLQQRMDTKPRIIWVGKATPEQREHFANDFGVSMTGYVPSVQPFVGPATVFIVPLRFGGGTRLKILDAWAMGKAVVSTSVGCEGLDARDGENIVIRDDPEQFAAAVVDLLADSGRVAALGRAARETAERVYSWDVIADDMFAAYREAMQPSTANTR